MMADPSPNGPPVVLNLPKPAPPGWRAPRHLRPATRRWANGVARTYELEPHHLMLLRAAGEAWDELQGAREVIARDGATYTDRWGQPRPRPEVRISGDARIAFARLLRELALDVSAPADEARPPGIAGRRR